MSSQSRSWTVYILKCSDGTLYTGITVDLQRRLTEHQSGRGSKYTRTRRPVHIRASRGGFTHSEALRFEHWIKSLPVKTKVAALVCSL